MKTITVLTDVERLNKKFKKLEKKIEDYIKENRDVERLKFNSNEPFQLLVNIKGESKSYIKKQLQKLIDTLDGPYGKPCQGICCEYDGEIDIVTRLWDGNKY